MLGWEDLRLEITSMADIPAGTGLGSSGSFTTALLKALHVQMKNLVHPAELAEQACKIEIDILKEPVGKQDQYIAAFGGITCFRFLPNGQVEAWPLEDQPAHDLRPGGSPALVLHGLYPLGRRDPQGTRRQEQEARFEHDRQSALRQADWAGTSRTRWRRDDLQRFGELMNTHWELKKDAVVDDE